MISPTLGWDGDDQRRSLHAPLPVAPDHQRDNQLIESTLMASGAQLAQFAGCWKRRSVKLPKNIFRGHGAEWVDREVPPMGRVLKAVLWILNTGAQWHVLSQSYPNYNTMHRRFQTGAATRFCAPRADANELRDQGALW